MDLYTLDSNFKRADSVDEFQSAIWTERYTLSGDVSLVVPASQENLDRFRNGTFLALDGSREVMILDTQSIDGGMLTVTGASLLDFLKQRILRFSPNHDARTIQIINPPKWIINTLVYAMCTDSPYSDGTIPNGLTPLAEAIPNLRIGTLDTSGASITVAVSFGTVFDAITTLSTSYDIGLTLYLEEVTVSGYTLRFDSYLGRDMTRNQSVNGVVTFSPDSDTLANIKELRSIAGYKTVAYAFAPELAGLGIGDPLGIAYASPDAETNLGFNRRSMMVLCDDITDTSITMPALQAILDQRARDALANNNFIKMVDGEVVPQSQYVYGQNYGLGDIIELEGNTGIVQNARVTEFIRTEDDTGEHAYPTVSVLADTGLPPTSD